MVRADQMEIFLSETDDLFSAFHFIRLTTLTSCCKMKDISQSNWANLL